MKSKYTYLSKNIILFFLSGFVPKLLSLILVPIYTSRLSTAEYGISELITTTVALLIPIFTLDIQDAVMRFALDREYKNEDVFTAAVRIMLIGFIIVCTGVFITSKLRIQGMQDRYLFFFILMYFTTSTYNIVSLFCRGIDKVNVMTVSSILNSVIMLSANILFLVVFKWGLNGYLFANTIGSLAALVWCFWGAKLYRYVKWRVPKMVVQNMIIFSAPLIINVIAWWVNSASDRYILTWILGVSVSGVYAAAYKIPNLLSVFQNIFAQAWSISAVKEFDKNDSDGFIGNMYTMMNFAMSVICSGIMIINIPVSKILFSNNFFEAWKYVPPLLISVVFNAMSLFIGSIFTAVKDTKTLSVSTITGALVNIVCNFILIPFYGAYGAAVATLLGYAVTFVMRHVIMRKHIRLRCGLRRDMLVYFVLFLQIIIAKIGIKAMFIQLIFFATILILYKDEIQKGYNRIRGSVNRYLN